MRTLLPSLLLIFCTQSVAGEIYATPVIIDVRGKVVLPPCVVDTTELNIDLGKIYASTLASPGSASRFVNGTIKFSACPLTTSGITASFNGDMGDMFYKNTGTASNVEIQLQDIEGNDLSNGKTVQLLITKQQTAELPLRVRAYTPQGNATEGNILGTINVTYTWQ